MLTIKMGAYDNVRVEGFKGDKLVNHVTAFVHEGVELGMVLNTISWSISFKRFNSAVNELKNVIGYIGNFEGEPCYKVAVLPLIKHEGDKFIKDFSSYEYVTEWVKKAVNDFFSKKGIKKGGSFGNYLVYTPFDYNGKKSDRYNEFLADMVDIYTAKNASEKLLYLAANEKKPVNAFECMFDLQSKECVDFLKSCIILDIDKRGLYSVRVRPSNAIVEKLANSANCTKVYDYSDLKKQLDNTSKDAKTFGDKYECFVYNAHGLMWEKIQERSWKKTADLEIQGKKYKSKVVGRHCHDCIR